MPYSNKHLVEVICSFEFIEEGPKWDSIYFGSYFEKIHSAGFSERQERKGVATMLPNGPALAPMQPFPVPVDQMVFRHPLRNWGIIISKATISFHVLSNYAGWDCFRNDLIIPFYEHYMAMGLGSGRRNCTVMYLNRFEKNLEENLSDYFTIASPIDKTLGMEKNTILQRLFQQSGDLLLITRLTTQNPVNNKYMVNLECGATSVNSEMPWSDQVEKVHSPILQFFESIITDKQRSQL